VEREAVTASGNGRPLTLALPKDCRGAWLKRFARGLGSEVWDEDGKRYLDFGAGIRDRYFDNVVNYEIAPNPTVDVLGDGERLPFADNTFDAAVSIAVFEHVRNPFDAAKELLRVLKPGGAIYLQVPFLFHEHGYPNHYYNMTQAGLVNLFGDAVDVKHVEVIDYGQPICLLTIFLDHYVRGLPSDVAARFKNMRVLELLTPYFGHLHYEYVTKLDDESKQKLACCNSLLAEKRR
jgi:SAM-dependent methyltransferase